tara:strand:+ start:177 stop:563 length:387 start_codon:yes stop_codon:yes gene_type:complete
MIMNKLLNISDLSKKLDLINPNNKKPQNYVLRYWEKEFKQIKPKIINKRRYYSKNTIETIKLVKYLIKDKGMSINGVKIVLNSKINKLDDYDHNSLKAEYHKLEIKSKTKKVLERIKKLKKYGKKNSP